MAKIDDLLGNLDTALRDHATASAAAVRIESVIAQAVAALKAELDRTPVPDDLRALLDRMEAGAARTKA